MQGILKTELHYQINLIRLINIITRFLYQICPTDKSDWNNYLWHRGVLRNKSNIYDGAFCEYSYRRKAVHYFCKKLHLRSLTGVPNSPLEYLKMQSKSKIYLLSNGVRIGKHLCKNEGK